MRVIEKIYLDQVSFTLPKSFHNSGLDPEAKAKLVAQWADASATCQAEALYAYSVEYKIPLADLVADDEPQMAGPPRRLRDTCRLPAVRLAVLGVDELRRGARTSPR